MEEKVSFSLYVGNGHAPGAGMHGYSTRLAETTSQQGQASGAVEFGHRDLFHHPIGPVHFPADPVDGQTLQPVHLVADEHFCRAIWMACAHADNPACFHVRVEDGIVGNVKVQRDHVSELALDQTEVFAVGGEIADIMPVAKDQDNRTLFIDWLIDWLISRPIWLIDWLIDRPIRLIDWLIDWLSSVSFSQWGSFFVRVVCGREGKKEVRKKTSGRYCENSTQISEISKQLLENKPENEPGFEQIVALAVLIIPHRGVKRGIALANVRSDGVGAVLVTGSGHLKTLDDIPASLSSLLHQSVSRDYRCLKKPTEKASNAAFFSSHDLENSHWIKILTEVASFRVRTALATLVIVDTGALVDSTMPFIAIERGKKRKNGDGIESWLPQKSREKPNLYLESLQFIVLSQSRVDRMHWPLSHWNSLILHSELFADVQLISSEPSLQSLSPSQIHCFGMHRPDEQGASLTERNWIQSINQSINQSTDQPINQSINKSINQSIEQSIDHSVHQSIKQSIESLLFHNSPSQGLYTQLAYSSLRSPQSSSWSHSNFLLIHRPLAHVKSVELQFCCAGHPGCLSSSPPAQSGSPSHTHCR